MGADSGFSNEIKLIDLSGTNPVRNLVVSTQGITKVGAMSAHDDAAALYWSLGGRRLGTCVIGIPLGATVLDRQAGFFRTFQLTRGASPQSISRS